MTNQTVIVPSAIVINDNTDHIFKLKLVAKVNKPKLRRGILVPVPTGMITKIMIFSEEILFLDINMASKSIQHQGPADDPVG